MTRIKLCGLSRVEDIIEANNLSPDYIGFVFAPKRKRYVTPEKAGELKAMLAPEIKAVGVFLDEDPAAIIGLLKKGIIDIAQLHGHESHEDIFHIKEESGKPVIKAFKISSAEDLISAEASPADHILLDSGAGTGTVFDWRLLSGAKRPYFLAGGLSQDNVALAINSLHPFAVDVSSGIETGGVKDPVKMERFVRTVRQLDAEEHSV